MNKIIPISKKARKKLRLARYPALETLRKLPSQVTISSVRFLVAYD
jgi:hypothetical protein